MRHALTFFAMALLGSASCTSSADDTNQFTDVYFDPSLPDWTIAQTPVTTVGGADERDGYAIGSLRDALIIGDRLVIADASAHELRFYSLDGELQARSGREGGGPGEFKAIRRVAFYDTASIAVWDVQLRRVTVLGVDGAFRRFIRPDLSGTRSLFPSFVGITRTGHIVFRETTDQRGLRSKLVGELTDTMRYVILEPDGSWGGVTVLEPGVEVYFTTTRYQSGSTPLIFGRTIKGAVIDGALVTGNTDSLAFRRIANDGGAEPIAMIPWMPVAVQQEWVSAVRDELRRQPMPSVELARMDIVITLDDGSGAEALDAGKIERIESTPHRATLPAFSDLVPDASGNAWVSAVVVPGTAERHWIIMSSTGDIVARARTPADLELLSIGAEYVAVRTKDDLDRDGVAVHRINR